MSASVHIDRGHPSYPPSLYLHFANQAPKTLTARGSLDLLRYKPLVALFCSVRCSEEIILQTYDLARALSDAGVTIISGFHSPMEKECLTTLLQHNSPVVLCPARSIERLRLRNEWKTALQEKRMLLLSSFAEQEKETTPEHALTRNRFVAALADTLLIAHATPRGRLEQLCDQVLSWGKPVFALEGAENSRLLALGAKRVWIDHIRKGEAFGR